MRIHLIAPMTGYVASFVPICIAVEARSPGARKYRYLHAVDRVGVLVHERSEADPHRGEVEDRDQEARRDRSAPGPLVGVGPVAERPPRRRGLNPACPVSRPGVSMSSAIVHVSVPLELVPSDAQIPRNAQSTSVRPVSRKKTSSSVARRTSALSGRQSSFVHVRADAESPSTV